MRAARACAIAAGVASVALAAATTASADPLPPGAIQIIGGAIAGTNADASRMGFGYQVGASASWQPISSERRVGWAFRWSTLFGANYDASAAAISDPMRTVMMDLTAGVRFRPWTSPQRYLTARAGAALLRSDQIIAPSNSREFVGPVASVGIDQYAFGHLLFSVDVRYGMIANGPSQIALIVGAGLIGP